MVVTFQETSSPLIDQEIVFSFALGHVDVIGWLCAHALVILIAPMVLAQGFRFSPIPNLYLWLHGERLCFLEEAH